MLTKEQILNARNARMKKCYVDALGGEVMIRVLTVAEREKQVAECEGLSTRESLLVYATYIIGDACAERVFTDWKELEDTIPEDAIWELLDLGDQVNSAKKAK